MNSRIGAWLFASTLLLSLVACGSRESEERLKAEETERAVRAAAAAQKELEADHKRFSNIVSSRAPETPRAPAPIPSVPDAPAAGAALASREASSTAPPSPAAVVPRSTIGGQGADLGNDASIQLTRAVAVLDNLQVDGLDCYTTLKVYASPNQTQLKKCLAFMERMVKGSEWTQALEVLSGLTKSEQFVREHYATFAKAKRLTEELTGYNEFAWARMRTITGSR